MFDKQNKRYETLLYLRLEPSVAKPYNIMSAFTATCHNNNLSLNDMDTTHIKDFVNGSIMSIENETDALLCYTISLYQITSEGPHKSVEDVPKYELVISGDPSYNVDARRLKLNLIPKKLDISSLIELVAIHDSKVYSGMDIMRMYEVDIENCVITSANTFSTMYPATITYIPRDKLPKTDDIPSCYFTFYVEGDDHAAFVAVGRTMSYMSKDSDIKTVIDDVFFDIGMEAYLSFNKLVKEMSDDK